MSANHPVPSLKQVRQITRSRIPHVPVEYETAVKALQACITLDDTKYWADKSEALAAWGKIYRSDDAGLKARRLRLHAYRRMGELATELAKQGGKAKEPRLIETGLKEYQARAALATYRLPKRTFKTLINSPRPPSPLSVRMYVEGRVSSDGWMILSGRAQGSNNSLLGFRAFCLKKNAKKLARSLTKDEAKLARNHIRVCVEWLDEFEQYLPK